MLQRCLPHNSDYVFFYFRAGFGIAFSISQKSQPLHLPAAYSPGFHGINARRIHRGMSEQIGKAHNILFNRIKCPREKVAEIVRKYLCPVHICTLAERFHHLPYICPVNRPSRFGDENTSACYFPLRRIFFQHFAKAFRNDYNAHLALHIDVRPSVSERFHADILQFAHADSCCASRLHKQI